MPRRFGQALRIGVSRRAVSLLCSSRWGGQAPAVLAEQAVAPRDGDEAGAWQAIGLAVNAVLQGGSYAGWPVSFVLADELARLWQVSPPQGVAGLGDLQAAAALRFQSLYGEAPAAWALEADWDNRAPFFAAAVPRGLLAAMEQAAAAHKLAVVEVAPHFVKAWNRWQGGLKTGGWFGLVHDAMLTLAAVDGRRLAAVRALAVPDGADAAWLVQAVRREALLLDLAPPARLQLCGQVPPAWARTDVDGMACQQLDRSQRAGLAGLSSAAALACGGGRV